MTDSERTPDKSKAAAAKQQGNDAFGKKQWAEAVGFYSVAHLADPTEPTYPLNRAMAYIKLNKFIDAERDCTIALQLSPNNIKALYRRATAKVGADKLDSAIVDYEAVLRLDAGNAEAKAGLAKARQALESQKPRRTEPLDVLSLSKGSIGSSPKPSSAEGPIIDFGSPLSSANTTPKQSSSSVEAARKFLEQVGMSDQSGGEHKTASSKPSNSALPAKLPGETGGFLREVTTRKTATQPKEQTSTQATSATLAAPIASSEQLRPGGSEMMLPSNNPGVATPAKRTASALRFGGPSTHTTSIAPTPQLRPQSQAVPGKMSATEFHRRWKNKPQRLELLSSINPDSIPVMMDAMLEPELVADILQTLKDGQRASPQDMELLRLIEATLAALPRCKRFGMTVSMLDPSEKRLAAHLIDAVGRADLQSVWEVVGLTPY